MISLETSDHLLVSFYEQLIHLIEASFWCVKNFSQARVAGISPVLPLRIPGLTVNIEGIPQALAEWMNERSGVYLLLPAYGEKLDTRKRK